MRKLNKEEEKEFHFLGSLRDERFRLLKQIEIGKIAEVKLEAIETKIQKLEKRHKFYAGSVLE